MGNKVIKYILLVIAAVFVIHQFYSSAYKPIVTESAEYFETNDGVRLNATVIRNESIITSKDSGALHFVTQNGTRVAKGGIIASLYGDSGASATVNRINELNDRIADIKEITSYNDRTAADLDIINSKVDTGLNSLIRDTNGGNIKNTNENLNAFLSAVNRRQMVTGEQISFDEKLAALESELASLNASLPAAKGYIRAPQSGYFVSSKDGYEEILSGDKLDAITPEILSSVHPIKSDKDIVGKIVSDYEWYIAAPLSVNESLKYKAGDMLTVKTNISNCPELSVTVKQVNMPSGKAGAVLILACDQMSNDLALVRNMSVTVISKSYSGLKVPKKALHVVSSETGVYVVSGAKLKFIPTTVIYSTDDFVVCSQEKSNKNVLRLYDEVVVKGKKLYDGKLVG